MAEGRLPGTMRVPRFIGQRRIDWVDRPVPEPGPGQLLVEVRANALCGSERGQYEHGAEVTPGHETAGVVAAAGAGTQTATGTPGVIYLMDFCRECRSCRLGHTNQCLRKRGDMGFNRDGGYGPYELVDEHIFFPVDAGLPPVEATLLLDIMGTGGHALGRARAVREDITTILVAGAGPVGLGVLAMAKLLLGDDVPVLISDVVPYRLALAERLGGVPIDLRRTTVPSALRDRGLPAIDLAIDTSGSSGARQACVEALGKRGVLVCVGHGGDLRLTVSPDLIATERAVLGSEYFRFDELPANLERLREHRAYLGQIITHRLPARNLLDAFELFLTGESGKVVVEQ